MSGYYERIGPDHILGNWGKFPQIKVFLLSIILKEAKPEDGW